MSRAARRESAYGFWRAMAADGLLPAGADTGWLGDTTTLLAAETYRLITRTLGYDLDRYEAWLRETLTRLAAAATV